MSQRTLLFASWHFYADQSNGASVSTRLLLHALAAQGWRVRTFCGFTCDDQNRENVPDYLEKRGLHVLNRTTDKVDPRFSSYSFLDGRVESILFCPDDRSHYPSKEVGETYLKTYSALLDSQRPDIVAAYGGYWFAPHMLHEAKRHGAKTVVFLHNFAYTAPNYFRAADLVVTPSAYASEYYRRELGIESVPIAPLTDWKSILSADNAIPNDEKHVLFVNPSFPKGAFLFAAIAAEMNRIRPDVRFLVVEGNAGSQNLMNTGVDWSQVKNIRIMKNTPRQRSFYSRARITLIPSFLRESFCRVAAESMAAGIPVVASDRGALPETVGNAGIILPVSARYTPESRELPTAEETAPWIEAILSLWDDPEYCAKLREKGQERAKRLWDFETVLKRYETELERLI